MTQPIDIRKITLTALMGALIFVLTRSVQIATPTQGYIHLGDAGVMFAALAFGPGVAGVAGGVGTALADITSGYAQWALFSLLIHGFQGVLIGWLARRPLTLARTSLIVVVSAVVVIVGYFWAGTLMLGMGVATTELLANTIQGISGGLIGLPLYLAVRRAYPPLNRYKEQAGGSL